MTITVVMMTTIIIIIIIITVIIVNISIVNIIIIIIIIILIVKTQQDIISCGHARFSSLGQCTNNQHPIRAKANILSSSNMQCVCKQSDELHQKRRSRRLGSAREPLRMRSLKAF